MISDIFWHFVPDFPSLRPRPAQGGGNGNSEEGGWWALLSGTLLHSELSGGNSPTDPGVTPRSHPVRGALWKRTWENVLTFIFFLILTSPPIHRHGHTHNWYSPIFSFLNSTRRWRVEAIPPFKLALKHSFAFWSEKLSKNSFSSRGNLENARNCSETGFVWPQLTLLRPN